MSCPYALDKLIDFCQPNKFGVQSFSSSRASNNFIEIAIHWYPTSRTDNTRFNLFDLQRWHPLPHGAWVGLASPAMRGEEDRELTFKVGDGATGSGMVTGVGDDDRGTAGGIEAEGRVGNGVGAMLTEAARRRWHDVEGGDGAEGRKLGQPDGANQNFTAIKVLRQRGYSPYTRYVIGIA
jgi:hypothetical protein